MNPATQQDTESFIFGSGFDIYSWWGPFERQWEYDDDHNAPDGWVWNVWYEDAETEAKCVRSVQHNDIMRAARYVVSGRVKVNDTLKRECKNLLFNVDECDMDAGDADCLMQIAVMGDVYYG